MADIISIGDKITLVKINTNKELLKSKEKPKTYVSQLLENITDEKLKIAMPIDSGRIIPLSVGDKYNTCFYTEKGLYQCKTVVSDRYREGNLFILVVSMLSPLEKNQRRQFYRLETVMKVKMRTVENEEKLILNKRCAEEERDNLLGTLTHTWYDAVIIDLSGGGIRFTTTQKIEKGDMINFKLDFNITEGYYEYKLYASIIYAIKLQNKVGYFEYRAEFCEIKSEHREHVIKFVFEEERKRRQKEKGLTK